MLTLLIAAAMAYEPAPSTEPPPAHESSTELPAPAFPARATSLPAPILWRTQLHPFRRKLLRTSSTGLALGAVGRLASVGPWVLTPFVGDMLFVGSALTATSIAGDITTGWALHTASRDLKSLGVDIGTTPLWTGEAMSGIGLAMAIGGASMLSEDTSGGMGLLIAGGVLNLTAMIPMGIQHGRTVRAYRTLTEEGVTEPTPAVVVWPTVDPLSRSLGLSGRFR